MCIYYFSNILTLNKIRLTAQYESYIWFYDSKMGVKVDMLYCLTE